MENFMYRSPVKIVAILDLGLKLFLLIVSGVVLSFSFDIVHIFSVLFVLIELGAAVKLFISTKPSTDFGRAVIYARFWRNLSISISALLLSAAIYCLVRGCRESDSDIEIGYYVRGGFPAQYLLYVIFLILGTLLVHNYIIELDLVMAKGLGLDNAIQGLVELNSDEIQIPSCPEDVIIVPAEWPDPEMALLALPLSTELNFRTSLKTPPPPTYDEVFGKWDAAS